MLERAMQLFEMKRRMQEEKLSGFKKYKNISSERILPIDAQTIEMLKIWKKNKLESFCSLA